MRRLNGRTWATLGVGLILILLIVAIAGGRHQPASATPPTPSCPVELSDREIVRIANAVAGIVVDRLQAVGPGRVWLSVREIVERGTGGQVAVVSALQDGSLHGHQAKKGGHWRVQVAAVDAWVQGRSDAEQARLCGCEASVDRPSVARRRPARGAERPWCARPPEWHGGPHAPPADVADLPTSGPRPRPARDRAGVVVNSRVLGEVVAPVLIVEQPNTASSLQMLRKSAGCPTSPQTSARRIEKSIRTCGPASPLLSGWVGMKSP